MIDIKSKKCIYINCVIRPTYNYINEEKAIFCVKHKL